MIKSIKRKRKVTICIVGLGYVGLPLALAFAEKTEENIYGLDIDGKKIEFLRKGLSYFKTIDDCQIKKVIKNGSLIPTTDAEIIRECDSVIICVPTPLGKHNEPDTTYIKSTMDAILPI